jgi:hypothetical protein
LYETHFPSKLTEYLALGMPTLITGPAYATGVRWGLRHPHAAVTLADERPEQLLDALAALRDHAARRQQLASGALSAGERDFNPVHIRGRFLDTLRSASRAAVRVAS